MAPEQITEGTVDRRADVWALGVVLWEMLTLRRLFRRSNDAETMYAALEARIPAPSELNPQLPEELDAVLLRALDRNLESRIADTRTLSRELQRVWARHSEDPATAADVGDKLRELFPGEEDRQYELIEIARADEGVVPRVAIGNPNNESFQGQAIPHPPEPVTKVARRAQRGPLLVIVIVALLGGFGTAAGFLLGAESSGSEAAESPAVERPAPDGVEAVTAAVEPPAVEPEEPPEEGWDGPATAPDPAGEPVEEPDAVARPANARRRTRRRTTARDTRTDTPAESAPAPEAPVAQEGTVAVVVPGGWANVYDARGRLLGVTPLRAALPAGSHRLQLRFFGNPPPVTVAVEVPAGGIARVSRPAPASD